MIAKRAGCAVARGKEGRAREAAPSLQRKEAEFDQSEPEPAIALGQRDTGPALFACEVPEGFVDMVLRFEQRQQRFCADPRLQYAARLGRDRELSIVIEYRHRLALQSARASEWRSSCPCRTSRRVGWTAASPPASRNGK